MCAMGLQSLLQKAEVNEDISRVAICRNGLWVSYLIFADDNVLFCCATEAEYQKIREIFYERGSCQNINKEKTNIFFSSNTSQPLQSRIQQLLGVLAIR